MMRALWLVVLVAGLVAVIVLGYLADTGGPVERIEYGQWAVMASLVVVAGFIGLLDDDIARRCRAGN